MAQTLNARVEDQTLINEDAQRVEYKPVCFAEMYMEDFVGKRSYVSPTACTWRGVPTIDDW